MKKQLLGAAGILAAGLIVGSTLSLNAAANAAGTESTTSSTTDSTTTQTTPQPPADIFSSTPVRDDEEAVSSDVAAKLTAAAQAKYPGATVIRAETDGDGAAFEVHLKKADGSVVTVKFDASYNITGTEEGFGPGPKGGHGPRGDHDDNDGQGDDDNSSFQVPSTGTQNG